jgi:hypothetical protein
VTPLLLEFSWPEDACEFTGMSFVFCNKGTNQWFNNSDKNFSIPFFKKAPETASSADLIL